MKFSYDDFDLSGVGTYPLASRASKVRLEDFARPFARGAGLSEWFDRMPKVLAAADLRAVVEAIAGARHRDAGILWGLGAHVVKTGLAPILIDLMERGFVSGLAMNGAGLIHDFEIAISGSTSEDVDDALGPGRFGMARETGQQLNQVIADGVAAGLGIGQAVGRHLVAAAPAHADVSLTAAASRLGIPLTVHVAIGTDVIHMHPSASGAALGEGSLRDFRYFAGNVAKLAGGVYLNCGSSVVLPEVFLKAVGLARNRGISLDGLTTVNLDFVRHYRPETNVVSRPVAGVGRGYSIVGHHEIMIPLLAAALVEKG